MALNRPFVYERKQKRPQGHCDKPFHFYRIHIAHNGMRENKNARKGIATLVDGFIPMLIEVAERKQKRPQGHCDPNLVRIH